MTGLRTALADLRLEVAALPMRQALPPESRRPTRLALQEILRGRDAPTAEPAPDRLEQGWQQLRDCCRTGGNPGDLPTVVLGNAIWLLWEKGRRACELPGVLAAVQACARERPRYLNRFVEAWLRDYVPEDEAMRRAGAWLADAVMQAPPASLAVWQRAERRHALFSRSDGPASVARAVLAGDDPPALSELGFDTPARGAGGYMRAVMQQTGAALPARLSTPAGGQILDRAETVFVSGGALRFDEPAMCGLVADALVGAWTGSAPPEALRHRILDILLTRIGDPRFQAARWDRASERTRQIVTGWLARVTLSAFFGVIGQYAGAAGMGHQWEARRKFWSACLEKGWVDDAWLVLGPNVAAHVRRNEALLGAYGTLDGGNLNNHSVLMMRIGGTVFAEWSHNGKLYAWPAGSSGAPAFAKRSYAVDTLKSGGLGFPPPVDRPDLQKLPGPGLVHHADTWRGRVAALLRQRDSRHRIEPREWA